MWGTNKGDRGVHLLNWEVLSKPKKLGGANLKPAKDVNRAMMAKLAWRVLKHSGEAWCEVLRAKYGLKVKDGANLRRKRRESQMSRGAVWGAALLRRGLKWTVGNGRAAAFWKDVWLGESPLCDRMQHQLGEKELELKIEHFWDHSTGWRWEQVGQGIPMTSMVEPAGTTVSSDPLDLDEFGWGPSRGRFRVRDAYRLSRGHTDQAVWEGWAMLWKMKVQERVKVFFWIMSHGRLMTNEERWKRRIAASPLCGRCHQEEEGILHAIRDCAVARDVWICVIKPADVMEFFSLDLQDWALWIMKKGKGLDTRRRWTERIATACWMQWGWRHAEIFNGVRLERCQRLKMLLDKFEEDEVAFNVANLQALDREGHDILGRD